MALITFELHVGFLNRQFSEGYGFSFSAGDGFGSGNGYGRPTGYGYGDGYGDGGDAAGRYDQWDPKTGKVKEDHGDRNL